MHGCGRPRPLGLTTFIATLIVSFGCASSAGAVTKTWGGGSGEWSTGANWSPVGAPSATDDAVIASGSPTLSAADAGVGSIDLRSGAGLTVSGDRTLTVGTSAASKIASSVLLSHGTLRLNGTTTWSAGDLQLEDAGVVQNAGTLHATGAGSVPIFDGVGANGRRAFDVLPGGLTDVSGSLAVFSELDDDGTLRVLTGASLQQFNAVASPAGSTGAFEAQGTGVLTLSNVVMGAGSSASGTGTIAFTGGPSRVAPGAAYSPAVTDLGSGGELDFDDDGTTGALRTSGFGTRRGDGTLTVGSGNSDLGGATFTDAGTTAFTAGSHTTIDDNITLDAPTAGHTLRLNGTTTWSAGALQLQDAGIVENAGELDATGAVAVTIHDSTGPAGRRALHVLAGGLTQVSGTLSVFSELENDGTVRALAGGTLQQFNAVASPADSSGTFDAQGTGVLSLSNVVMGATSSATGTGTIRFEGGPSRVVPGAGYAAGVTDLGTGGDLDFDDNGTTGALRTSGFGTRRGDGTLTVGSGNSELGGATFTDAGTTAFTAGSHTTIDDHVTLIAPVAGHTLRLNGTTTWSAGNLQLQDAGVVEDAGQLDVTGFVAVTIHDSTGPAGRRALHVLAGGLTQVSGTLFVFSELENDGTLRGLAGGTLQQSNAVASPADSSGVFEAQGTGVLSLSNVVMGATSSATGTGTIRFDGGPSRVVSGAAYAAGITDLGSGGDLDFDDNGTTGALRTSGFGTRRGDGTLTVGSGNSDLGGATFTDAGTTAFTTGSHTTIDDNVTLIAPVAGHTLRLNGTTTWSAGSLQLQDAGIVENRGALNDTGNVAVTIHDSTGVPGPRELRNVSGTLTVPASDSLFLATPLELQGGVLAGAGTVQGSVVNTGGTVSPGSPPGTLTITGDYTQAPAGTLRTDIAGIGAAQHDRLDVAGTATLDGTLRIVNAPGFDPGQADAFRIVDAGVLSGTFAEVAGAQATAAKRYLPSYDATGVSLGVGLGPGNSARPSIPTAAALGDAVSCDPGAWTGSPSFAYAWLRNGAVVGAGQAYTLVDADGGQSIVCRVTATNANGSTSVDSNVLKPPAREQPPPPPPTPTPTPIATPDPIVTPAPPPETGETVNVAAERGKVTVRLPNGTTVPIDDTTQIVTGSVVDTRQGAVRLNTRGAGGKLETGVFSDGLFRVTQSSGRRPVTELKLVEKLSCPKAKGARDARKRKRKRRLWGDATGNYRTRGQYGSAVNTGTKWMTEDSCRGTLFKVTRGVIRVTPNGSRRSVRVRAGNRYLVRRKP